MIQIKQCRHGNFMYYANDFYIGQSMERYGEYSEGEVALWKQFLKPGMTVVDVGANIGAFTVPLAKIVAPKGRVFAAEPQRQLFQILNGNLALNNISNAATFMGCFGEKPDTIKMPVMDADKVGNFGGVSAVVGDKVGVTVETAPGFDIVPVQPLDALGLPSVHFIKVDVEGMETDVLKGASETIEKHKPILYVENDRPDKSAALIQWLLDKDYRLYWHLPTIFSSTNYNNNKENIFGGTVSINMLCAHKSLIGKIDGMREITEASDTCGVGRGTA